MANGSFKFDMFQALQLGDLADQNPHLEVGAAHTKRFESSQVRQCVNIQSFPAQNLTEQNSQVR